MRENVLLFCVLLICAIARIYYVLARKILTVIMRYFSGVYILSRPANSHVCTHPRRIYASHAFPNPTHAIRQFLLRA